MKVRNVSGATIPNGKLVYFNGRTGNRPNIYLAKGDALATHEVVGMTTTDIDDNSDGFITTLGYVRQIKTNYTGTGDWGTTWNEGDPLWLSKTVAGDYTNVEPSIPHFCDRIGYVGVVGSAGIGSILITIVPSINLEELSDVNGTPLTITGQFPSWNQTTGYFDFDKKITDYVPYIGATGSLDLGAFNLSATRAFTGLGTALLPAYSFTGDTNTGMWSPTADTLAWSTGGTERLRVNSSGNVGIGTTAPSARTHIISTTEQLRVGYDVSNYFNATVGSTGITTFNAVGSSPSFVFSDQISAPNFNQKNFSVAVPTGTDAIEFATVTDTNFSANVEIWFTVNNSGYAQSKRYFTPVSYNGTGGQWHKLLPVSTTGAYGSNDAEIDVKVVANTATFRVRRIGGSTFGIANVTIAVNSDIANAVIGTASATYASATVSDNYAPTSLTMKAGKTGIANDAPIASLDVIGSTNIFRLGYNLTNYLNTDILSNGAVTITSIGTAPSVNFIGGGFNVNNVANGTDTVLTTLQGAPSTSSGTARKEVLRLQTSNVNGVAYGQQVALKLSRWEDSGGVLAGRASLVI